MEKQFESFQVYKNLIKVLKDRDYNVAETEEYLDYTDFCAIYGEIFLTHSSNSSDRIIFYATKKDDVSPSSKSLIFFPKEGRVGVGLFRTACEKMNQIGVTHAIIVSTDSISPVAKRTIGQQNPGRYSFEHFSWAKMQANIVDHTLVPKHRKLSPEESFKLLAK
jgi:DNA-directed RNA polymerase I, II, and III subunit RPABC1